MLSFQSHRDHVISELEETKSRHRTTVALLGQKTMELDTALKELSTTHEQVATIQKEMQRLGGELEESQGSLERTKRERSELESQLLCLRQNLTNQEEAQAQGAREREEHRRKEEEEMDGRMRKMEHVLEEELEEFEKLIKAKEDEVRRMLVLFIMNIFLVHVGCVYIYKIFLILISRLRSSSGLGLSG